MRTRDKDLAGKWQHTSQRFAMFDHQVVSAVTGVAERYNLSAAALIAIAEVECSGNVFEVVDGRAEPLIKFEWHDFHRRLSPANFAKAGNLTPSLSGAHRDIHDAQISKWALLNRAVEIDPQAAFESACWGVGQIPGKHWRWLGFSSVAELANLCRRDVAGQIELMMRYIENAELTGDVRAGDWESFARGFSGRSYRKQRYHLKFAAAHARWVRTILGERDNDGAQTFHVAPLVTINCGTNNG